MCPHKYFFFRNWFIHKLFSLQIIARETQEGGAASAPVTVTVELNDVNDNYPRFPIYPPVTISAGAGKRTLLKVWFYGFSTLLNYFIHIKINFRFCTAIK